MNEKRADLPYEKAAEETAKTIGKGLDLVDKASPAIADIYNVLVGDRVSEYRKRNADKFARETQRIIDERNLKEKREVPEDLAAPLLEAALRDHRDALQKLYAALAVNAMDPAFHDDVRPEFVETVRKWQPLDVRVMQFATSRPDGKAHFGQGDVHSELAGVRQNAIAVSLEHLRALGCLSSPGSNSYTASPYGTEIMRAVSARPEACW
jgi:hypothetical protein